MDWMKWLKGLISAIIGAAANAITVVIVDPMAFNLNEGAGKLGMVALVSGIVAAAFYLKQAPLPAENKLSGQSGKASMSTVLLLFILGVCAVFMFSGCADMQKATATQQIMEQTNDPMMVSLAVYHDGLKLYVDAQELYKPYQEFIKETNPEIDTEIIGYFKKARKVLTDWKKFGVLPAGDETTFREALRDVSLTMARYMQAKS